MEHEKREIELSTEIVEMLKVGAAQGDIKYIEGRPIAVIPDGYKLESLENMLQAPLAINETFELLDVEGFVAYWKRFAADSSVIFVDEREPKFVAILDFSERHLPAWGIHLANYTCPTSDEWKIWNESSGRKMKQTGFAEFIEDNLPDIVTPDPALMLEISQTFEAKRDLTFSSSTRLSDGQTQFHYDEKIRGEVRHGEITIPERFVVGISPFLNGKKFEIDARLRYRINEGGLVIWYDLHRPREFFRKAVSELIEEIGEKTGGTIFRGTR